MNIVFSNNVKILQAYEGAGKGNPLCDHHPGVPVFHEGMKYWSCCNKKTSDFNAFLEQVGCSQGKHCWIKETVISCNYCFYL